MVDPDGFALENDRVSYISFRLCPGLVRLPGIVITMGLKITPPLKPEDHFIVLRF